jgi:hypothetical protein
MVLEQINIPFAPELAASVDISNHITESGIGTWLERHWHWLLAGLVFIFFLAWALGGFDKPKPAIREEPKPNPLKPPSSQPTPFPHLQTPRT